MTVELNVLFKKMQKDDKGETVEMHILKNEIPYKEELISMAGDVVVLAIETVGAVSAEFKSLQRDSKKVTLKFSVMADGRNTTKGMYDVAGSYVNIAIQPNQMTAEEFYDADEHEGVAYNIDTSGTVQVVEGQLSMDDEPPVEDAEDALLN